ncbi:MAG: NAD(P)/FAD-dependent oxidoreductase [Chitinophagaceae bacterium]|nr:MAG: NAD(P)/FAD-dependent oxidoreductase [Chitinophagaceae bacterium]
MIDDDNHKNKLAIADEVYDLIVVGGGAAGFFTAIRTKEHNPSMKVLILEKSDKILSKVRISGGGRCNVTHNCFNNTELLKAYPRGNRFLKKVFPEFGVKETVNWFEKNGVPLKIEKDGRMFPVSDNSADIINCFLKKCNQHSIEIVLKSPVSGIKKQDELFYIQTKNKTYTARKLMVAVGGYTKIEQYKWIQELGHKIINPVPSLFTFNIPEKKLHNLAGVSLENSEVFLENSKFTSSGPLLITHWGLSGPAILKLSSLAAEYLNEKKYNFNIRVNWNKDFTEKFLSEKMENFQKTHKNKKIRNTSIEPIPNRLWLYLLEKVLQGKDKSWGELAKKEKNKLIEILFRSPYNVEGKTTFKEEFVTCGGIDLQEINSKNMESTLHKDLYFSGEILNIDAVTGGYNFQAAWSCAAIAAKHIAQLNNNGKSTTR